MRPTLFALTLLCSSGFAAHADVLELPATSGSAYSGARPTKGSTMQAVIQQFGTPTLKHPTVGGSSRQQPPITRWDYPGFSVFFEYDHVVDSVVPGQPPAPQHIEELQASTP